MNRKFKYQGPTDSSVTLKVDCQDVDVVLFRGSTVELPDDHEYVKTLIALGYLAPQGDAPEVADAQGSTTTAKKGAK